MGGRASTELDHSGDANTTVADSRSNHDSGASTKSDDSLSMKMVIRGLKLKWPSVVSMDTQQLHQRLQQQKQDQHLVILDARPEEEFNVSHIAHARRVHPDAADVDSVYQDIKNISPPDDGADDGKITVLCYCSVGYRSSLYACALQKKLKQDKLDARFSVFNLEGSLFKWANEDRPMVDSTGAATTVCHPYSATWGKLLKPQCRYHARKDS